MPPMLLRDGELRQALIMGRGPERGGGAMIFSKGFFLPFSNPVKLSNVFEELWGPNFSFLLTFEGLRLKKHVVVRACPCRSTWCSAFIFFTILVTVSGPPLGACPCLDGSSRVQAHVKTNCCGRKPYQCGCGGHQCYRRWMCAPS